MDRVLIIFKIIKCRDDELATEIAWVIVYLSALSDVAISILVKSDVLQLLVERLSTSSSLQLLIPVSMSNIICILRFYFLTRGEQTVHYHEMLDVL